MLQSQCFRGRQKDPGQPRSLWGRCFSSRAASHPSGKSSVDSHMWPCISFPRSPGLALTLQWAFDGKVRELYSTLAVPVVTGPDFSGGPAPLSCGAQKRRFLWIGTGGQGGSRVSSSLFLRLAFTACASSTHAESAALGDSRTPPSPPRRGS